MIVDVSRGVVGRDMVFASVFDVETRLNFQCVIKPRARQSNLKMN